MKRVVIGLVAKLMHSVEFYLKNPKNYTLEKPKTNCIRLPPTMAKVGLLSNLIFEVLLDGGERKHVGRDGRNVGQRRPVSDDW